MLKFLSAQPDQPYFLWQLKVQIANFARYGIEQDMIILLAIEGEPSAEAQHLADRTSAQVHFIPDERIDKSYVPSVQFYLYAKYFESHQIGSPYMLIDSDIILTEPLRVEHLLADDVVYMSDTQSYLGHDYVASKGAEQMQAMAAMVGLSVDDLKLRDAGAGGAQTILKGLEDPAFWRKVEADSTMLYKYLGLREAAWKGDGYPIQRWTSGMWSFLWNLWARNVTTAIAPEMEFCWGSDPVEKRKAILHLAGVVHSMRDTHFFKGDYFTRDPFETVTLPPDIKNMSHVYAQELVAAKGRWV